MDLGLRDRVALVVGGGRGLGRACALALAREGADVAVISRTAEELESTAAAVRALGRRALALPLDATDLPALDSALQQIRAGLGPPVIAVLGAAALYQPRKLQHVEDAEAARFLAVDVGAAVAVFGGTLLTSPQVAYPWLRDLLLYWGYYHLVKQHYGFQRLYERKLGGVRRA